VNPMQPPKPCIVDIDGLAEILQSSKWTLRKVWRSYPHFFVGQGQDLRAARFDVNDVLAYLKERGAHDGSLEGRKEELLDRQISVSKETVQARGFQNQKGRGFVGSRQTSRGDRSRRKGDPYNLLSGVGD